MLAGRGDWTRAQEIGVQRPTPDWHILLAGFRELDRGKAQALADSDVEGWSADDLRLMGASRLGFLLSDWPPTYLHLDLSVLDPSIMPAVDSPAANGLSLNTLSAALESITANVRIAALTITGFNPARDKEYLSLSTSMLAIEAAVRLVTL